ncbi:hypothetical protein SRHO_G00121990 [Serrasalmus rhombeus]
MFSRSEGQRGGHGRWIIYLSATLSDAVMMTGSSTAPDLYTLPSPSSLADSGICLRAHQPRSTTLPSFPNPHIDTALYPVCPASQPAGLINLLSPPDPEELLKRAFASRRWASRCQPAPIHHLDFGE